MQELLEKLSSLEAGISLDEYADLEKLAAKYGMLEALQECFTYESGWLFMGLDFASLEDRISALTTKDPQKLKVYMGHIVYELNIDGVIHHIRDDATIVYDGQTYTGEEFYAAFSSL